MTCPECGSENSEVALYCYKCGHALKRVDASKHGRDNSYAIQPTESVHQLALVSTIMPHANRDAADNYRWALLAGAAVVVVFSLAGILPAAIVGAAFLVPLTYLTYIYDVNLWEETPVPVVGLVFLFTGLLATLTSIVFFRWIFDTEFLLLAAGAGDRGGGLGDIDIGALLIFAVLLPVVAEVLKQIGPLALANRPQYNDLIDALTLGVAGGTAYAAFETVIAYAPVFSSSQIQTTEGLTSWFLIVVNLMIVKSLIYGTATGLALAAYSGIGERVDGFSSRYYKAFGLAAGANIAYWLGVRLLVYAPFGQALALAWGVAVLAFLIIRIRVVLQAALLEAAVEETAANHRPRYATTDSGTCANCEVALLNNALFCIICGMSVRASSHGARRHTTAPVSRTGGAA